MGVNRHNVAGKVSAWSAYNIPEYKNMSLGRIASTLLILLLKNLYKTFFTNESDFVSGSFVIGSPPIGELCGEDYPK